MAKKQAATKTLKSNNDNNCGVAEVFCPVCCKHFVEFGSIITAANGKRVCAICSPDIDNCPQCSLPVKDLIRHHILEDLAQDSFVAAEEKRLHKLEAGRPGVHVDHIPSLSCGLYTSGTYWGPMKQGRPHGFGKFEDGLDGTVYTGQWRVGMQHGKGKVVFQFPSYIYTVEGEWYLGRLQQVFASGRYVGPTNDVTGLPHGHGEFIYDDGHRFSGDWCDGTWEGRGRLTCPNNDTIESDWHKGKREGWTVKVTSAGEKFCLLYENDQCVVCENGGLRTVQQRRKELKVTLSPANVNNANQNSRTAQQPVGSRPGGGLPEIQVTLAEEGADQRQNLNGTITPGGSRRVGPPSVAYSKDQVQITFNQTAL